MRLPKTAPTWNDLNRDELINSVTLNQIPGIEELIQRSNHNYLHWDKFRYQSIPDGFSHKALWLALERIRKAQQQCLPLELADDTKLWYWTPPLHQMWLHRIDQDAGGFVGSRSRLVPQDSDDRFLFNSLMEEAIASSQLEGATTTRPVAKMLLRTKRKPKDRHERMILNNYTAILNIRDMRNEQLTPEMLCAIQEIITYKTLDREDAAGRFKDSRDGNVCVVDAHTGEMLFEPQVTTTRND
jgi:hypothetical protein